jgi:UDP-GlcNAc:undecaprenyl-phosphate GlcNAc-1-phosphate transferase
MGRYDDLRSVRPFYKLLFQVVCALLVVDPGHALPILYDWEILRMALSIVWVVAIMNAVNMLDNMDAISGGVGMLIAFGLGIGSWVLTGTWTFVSLNLMVLGCAMLGFLFFNWHPSKVYMGDAGSMALGLVLAAGAMAVFGQTSIEVPGISFVILLLLFATPLFDTSLVTLNRLRHGTSPARGGKDHSTHQLAYLGIKERSVAGIFLALCATQTLLAMYMLVTPKLHTYTILTITVLYMCIHFISLWWISRKNLQKDKYSY